MLVPAPGAPPIVVASAADADQATMRFHAEFHRLRRDHVQGEVWVRRLDQDRPPMLRVTLSETAASTTSILQS
jgi:hypothetical protein